jgi:hypothetical protein
MAVRLSTLRAGRPLFTPRKLSGIYFCYRLSRPQGHCAARSIRSIEKSNNFIGNRTRDLPALYVPQPSTLPRVPYLLQLGVIYLQLISLHPNRVGFDFSYPVGLQISVTEASAWCGRSMASDLLTVFWFPVACLADSATLDTGALRSSEISLNLYQTSRCHIPENSTVLSHRYENHKFNEAELLNVNIISSKGRNMVWHGLWFCIWHVGWAWGKK